MAGFLYRPRIIPRSIVLSAYSKPFLTYERQVMLLESRGLICANTDHAVDVLRSVGYYHFSGYLYPYRLPTRNDGLGPVGRQDQVEPGRRFEQVESLIIFDRRLRSVLLNGGLLVELAMAARIAHVLGRRDPFGHLNPDSLDTRACDRVNPRTQQTAFGRWQDEYNRLQGQAEREVFVRHNLTKYGAPLPVWIACEFLDFGAVSNLFRLLKYRDRREIAAEIGINREWMLASWLTCLNYVRNLCAHNSRMWNRVMTVKPIIKPAAALPAALTHLVGVPNARAYFALAVTARLVSELHSGNDWHQGAAAMLASFPDSSGRSATSEMGVPPNWAHQSLGN